jgi:hypothetical protein
MILTLRVLGKKGLRSTCQTSNHLPWGERLLAWRNYQRSANVSKRLAQSTALSITPMLVAPKVIKEEFMWNFSDIHTLFLCKSRSHRLHDWT